VDEKKKSNIVSMKALMTPDSKLSSLIDSPPTLSDLSSDKGIKDFST
jgi:hypothetical protein